VFCVSLPRQMSPMCLLRHYCARRIPWKIKRGHGSADLGFEGLDPASDSDDDDMSRATSPAEPFRRRRDYLGLNRPKTPSWGDFLVSDLVARQGFGIHFTAG